jgi:hypothetical protein
LATEPTIFILDRDKGLNATNDKLGQNIIRAICAQHLKENFTTKYSCTLKPLFWRIIRANLIARFNGAIKELRLVNPNVVAYLLTA